MKITITMTWPGKNRSYNIQVPHVQRIADTLQVLKDNMPIFADIPRIDYVKDAETGRKISIQNTYEEAHLYSGTELLIP